MPSSQDAVKRTGAGDSGIFFLPQSFLTQESAREITGRLGGNKVPGCPCLAVEAVQEVDTKQDSYRLYILLFAPEDCGSYPDSYSCFLDVGLRRIPGASSRDIHCAGSVASKNAGPATGSCVD